MPKWKGIEAYQDARLITGVVLDLLVEEGYVQIIPHGGKNDQNVS